jgi:hypothetical protein
MVFLNAANDLQTFSTLNMNQMEKVAQNPDVRFVVQWKQAVTPFSPNPTFEGTRRYLVKPDSSSTIVSELIQDMGQGVDMGVSNTMRDFVDWATTYYPAERTVLVVWNHGNGWRRAPGEEPPSRAVSYDDETGNSIQIWQLAQAIGDHVVDILAWDASLMQMLEVAYEAKDRSLYVVGSEESPPGAGYPYDLIFQQFRDNPNAATSTLAKAFVTGMLSVPGYQNQKITQSVLDTSQLSALASATSALAQALIDNKDTIGAQIQQVRTQAQSYSPSSTRHYRDLDHVCELIQGAIAISGIQTAAASVRSAIANAVVWEGHNANSPNSRGISIDFSDSVSIHIPRPGTSGDPALDYSLMRFAADTMWNEWLLVAP